MASEQTKTNKSERMRAAAIAAWGKLIDGGFLQFSWSQSPALKSALEAGDDRAARERNVEGQMLGKHTLAACPPLGTGARSRECVGYACKRKCITVGRLRYSVGMQAKDQLEAEKKEKSPYFTT